MTKPEKWLILSIEKEGEDTIYKVFAQWIGGYTDGDSWKMNSGISRVEEEGDYFKFYGASGSCYECAKPIYGTGTSYTTGVLNNLIKRAKEVGGTITILPSDTNWLNIEYGI